MKEVREELISAATAECSARLQLLNRITVTDLRKIIVVPTAAAS